MSAESALPFDDAVEDSDDGVLEDDVAHGHYEVVTPGNDPLEDEAGIDPVSGRERREAKIEAFETLRQEVDL